MHLISASNTRQKQWTHYLLPSVSDLIFLVLLFSLSMGTLAPRLLGDGDTGWHIRNGELILSTHSITRVDPFSSTMQGKPWYAWEWLYDVAIAAVHGWSGLNGVVFVSAFMIAVTFALMFRLALTRGGTIAGTLLLSLLALGAATIHFLARPHILSWLLTVVWFHLLDSSENNPAGGRKLFWLPVIILLWVNVHGGFVMGFFLLGIYILPSLLHLLRSRNPAQRDVAGKRLKRLALVTLLSALATLANPYGYKLYVHIYQYLSNRFLMDHINEFQSPNFHGIAQQCFLLLCLVSLVALAARHQKPRLVELLVVLFAIASGLYASRNLPTSGILLALIIAPFLSNRVERSDAEPEPGPETSSYFLSLSIRMETLEKRLRGHLLPGLAVLVGIWICSVGGRVGNHQFMTSGFSDQHFPVQAVDAIEQHHISSSVFSPDSWGGYLIYRLYPTAKVVADDRHDLYGEQFFKEYLKLIRVEPGWDEVLKKNNIACVLVPAESSLAAALEQKPDWNTKYRDSTAELFQKK